MSELGSYIRSNLPADQYEGESSDQVVVHFKKGECTFDQVLLRYHPMLISKSSRQIFGLDRDDVYQEMLITLNKCCMRWDPNSDATFGTYLYNALTNKFKHLLRRQSSENYIANCLACSLDEDKDDGEGSTVPKYEIAVEFSIPIELTIDDLPIDSRGKDIVRLLVYGYSQAEVGRLLGLTRARINQIVREMSNNIKR